MKPSRRLFATLLLGASGLLLAAPLTVGSASKGTLTATFKQAGVAVENPFTRWSGQIDYDPATVAVSNQDFLASSAPYIGSPMS